MPSRVVRLIGAALFLVVTAVAQVSNDRESTVGMRARIQELVLPGSEVTVKPTAHDTPVVVRIVARRPHGDAFRYDLEYYGLDPGTYDLATLLVRRDGLPTEGLPEIPVEVSSILPPGQVKPNELALGGGPGLGGYRSLLWVGGILWILGLVLILGWRRRRPGSCARRSSWPGTTAPGPRRAGPSCARSRRAWRSSAAAGATCTGTRTRRPWRASTLTGWGRARCSCRIGCSWG